LSLHLLPGQDPPGILSALAAGQNLGQVFASLSLRLLSQPVPPTGWGDLWRASCAQGQLAPRPAGNAVSSPAGPRSHRRRGCGAQPAAWGHPGLAACAPL